MRKLFKGLITVIVIISTIVLFNSNIINNVIHRNIKILPILIVITLLIALSGSIIVYYKYYRKKIKKSNQDKLSSGGKMYGAA